MTVRENLRAYRERLAERFRLMTEAAQAKCVHRHVGHHDGHEAYGICFPVRLCLDCGLCEVGGWWCYALNCSHWHIKEDYETRAQLGADSGRIITPLGADEMNRLRVYPI